MAGLFSTPAIPTPPPTPKMPAPNDQAQQAAEARAKAQLAGLSGRESTNLDRQGRGNDTTYVGDVLGK